MTTTEIDRRKRAMKWWNNLSSMEKEEIVRDHLGNFRKSTSLTGREIQIIWESENG